MIHFILISVMIVSLFAFSTPSYGFEADGELEITFIGHGTLMFKYNDKIIHVDPWTKLADSSKK